MQPLRIAIVGFGPKGLFALERLLDGLARGKPGASLSIDLYEPHPFPGAGPVYDPRQPGYLRMNFAAEQVDAWPPDSLAASEDKRLSFAQWRGSHPLPCDEEYPPRALVGRYLAAAFEVLRAQAQRGVTIEVRSAVVHSIRRRRAGWEVATSDTAFAYDEVLVAIGHQTASNQSLETTWRHADALVPSVFPVEHWLGPQRIRPGATVAVRGFALTFIDAALALTEGRGARFETTDHPFRLDYTRAGDEVGLLVPFSRSGRPMLAKPSPRMAARLPELELIAVPARRRVLALATGFVVEVELTEIIEAVAEASLRAAGGVARAPSPDPAAELERSLAIATDVEPPDTQWALGHAWRTLYPAVVARLGGQGLEPEQWPAFRSLAERMERIAFGPPPVNAAKLLALIEAGRVDLGHLRGRIEGRGATTAIVSDAGERAVDRVVDAVLAGPGALGLHSELLEQLVGDGHCRIVAGRRGLDIDDDASCIDAEGNLSRGLSAIGRPTEDSVIGNDTLSRSLHPQAERWARRVVERCSDASRSEVAVR